ncbi:MAG: aminotransferase class IV [Bacteroidota bacterium]|nr:aminotransferase class IV [Bacteroidota bacterium]
MQRYTLYGDLLFESIRVIRDEPQFLKKHFTRLMSGAAVLSFETEDFNFEVFQEDINKTIKKYRDSADNNQEFLRLRFVMHRDSGGYYLPHSNKIKYFSEISAFKPPLKNGSLRVGIYGVQPKALGPLSNIKPGNSLLYVMASIWAKANRFDDALLINTEGKIIEATASNIFWFKNGQWYTPPLSDGCVKGIMREVFMEQNHVLEKSCESFDLADADRRILTNAIQGIRLFELSQPA